jgi:MFS family permease
MTLREHTDGLRPAAAWYVVQGLTFGIFYLLGGLPIGWLVDRMSRVRIITAGVAAWSLLTMFSGLASTFKQLFLMRIGVGIGVGTLRIWQVAFRATFHGAR